MNSLFRDELNFRDLGGYQAKDGRVIKNGCFYRSAGLYHFRKEELKKLEDLHIKEIIDLRTKEQMDRKPDPEIAGTVFITHSGLVSRGGEKIDFTSKGMIQTGEGAERQLSLLKEYYAEMPYENESFCAFFEEVKQGNTPILFHCATGKDRTGVLAMLLLLLLGCSKETAYEDYMLSNQYRKANIDVAMQKYQKEIQESPELKELILMKEGVSGRIGKAVLERLEERYSSVDEFFEKEYQFTLQEIVKVREEYTKSGRNIKTVL